MSRRIITAAIAAFLCLLAGLAMANSPTPVAGDLEIAGTDTHIPEVPEPATVGLLLAGLAVMGLKRVVRRRASK